MRFLRFFALILVVAIAYSAQAVFHPTGLIASTAPFFRQITQYLPELAWARGLLVGNARTLALFGTAFAVLTFGLLAAPWPLTELSAAGNALLLWTARARRRQRWAWSLIILALLLSLVVALAAWVQIIAYTDMADGVAISSAQSFRLILPPVLVAQLSPLFVQAPWLTLALWAASLGCFFLGCGLFPNRVQSAASEYASPTGQPQAKAASASWSLFLLLVTFAALQGGWQLTEIPRFVNPMVAQTGLIASDWLRSGDIARFFAMPIGLEPGLVGFSHLSIAIPTLFFYLTNDLLVSTRLAGLWAMLLVLTATWLLGTELFRRAPQRVSAELSEDQGQGPALVATILVMFTAATLLFSRLPILLEMVGWGSLGCWALLRGWRSQDRLAMALSGVLIGLSALLYSPGLAFVLIALGWWLGFALVQVGWVPQRRPAQRTGALLRGHFAVWLLGLWLVAAPQLGVRWFALGQWVPAWPGTFANWQATLLAFGQQGDLSEVGAWSIPFLHDLFVPILMLAIGALIFNLDRRVGWLLFTWLGGGVLAAIVLAPRAPLWPVLLPLLPAIGLVLAFGLDRLRATILQSAGDWLRNLSTYLLAGLVLWIGLNNGADYYSFANQQTDTVSALGYALRNLPADRPIVVVRPSNAPEMTSAAPQLRFLTNNWTTPPLATVTFTTTVPSAATDGTVLLIAPAEPALLAEVQAIYPAGLLFVQRDHLANPLFYRYTLPNR